VQLGAAVGSNASVTNLLGGQLNFSSIAFHSTLWMRRFGKAAAMHSRAVFLVSGPCAAGAVLATSAIRPEACSRRSGRKMNDAIGILRAEIGDKRATAPSSVSRAGCGSPLRLATSATSYFRGDIRRLGCFSIISPPLRPFSSCSVVSNRKISLRLRKT
jgi:hypothetical protein